MVEDRDNLSVSPDATLTEAMRAIDRNALGIVFVVEDGRLVGSATDGDIRRSILGGTGLDEPISEVMNDNPLAVRESWSEDEIERWRSNDPVRSKIPDVGGLTIPVLDDAGRPVDLLFVESDRVKNGVSAPPASSVETVLVIGGAGYIGSVLCRELLSAGYEVNVLDNLLYGDYGIADLYSNDRFTFVQGDMRSIEDVVSAIDGVDAVVHLGALVGDPASAIDSQKTLEINYHSTKLVAEICKYHQINRFIFASTCSVYGKSTRQDGLLTEESELNPVSLYAKSKIESERALLEMNGGNFSPTILRMATIYGLSPRMRFDLVVNILTAKAHQEETIPIFGGEQYRPNVHVRDAARAYIACLEAPIEDVDSEVYNVGSNAQNYRIFEIGKIIAKCFPDAEVDVRPEQEDERSYQVDFTHIQDKLDYEVKETIASGAKEIGEALEAGEFSDYTDDRYSNYRTIEATLAKESAD